MSLPRASQRVLAGLEQTAARALAVARARGAEHAEVRIDHGTRLSAQVREGSIELLSEAQSAGLSARVVCRGRVGTATTADHSPAGVEAAIARAIELAGLGEEDPHAEPPAPSLLARSWPDLELFDGAVVRVGAERATRLALWAERAALAEPQAIGTGGASCSRAVQHSLLATSGGFVGGTATTWIGLRAHAIAGDATGLRRSGHYWSGGRFLAQIEPPEAVGREAARRAARMLGARPIATGPCPVVFGPDAAATLIGLFAGCALGDAVVRRRSYLSHRLGSVVAGPKVTLVDDPLLRRAAASRGFDGEGLPTRRVEVVKRGVLRSFLLDSRSGRRLDLRPTGSAAGGGGLPHASASNFFMQPGRMAPASLRRGIRRGLYVQALMGLGFDPGTGELSRGAEGFAIEEGELGHPVAEVTVSRNLDELLRGIDAVGRDLSLRGAVAAPSFRVDWAMVAGT